MKRWMAYFFFFLLVASFASIQLSAEGVEMGVFLASSPIAQLSYMDAILPPSQTEFIASLLTEMSKAVHEFHLSRGVLFFLALSLNTFFVLSVKFKRAWFSLAALSSFCLLLLVSLSVYSLSPYSAILLMLSFLLILFDMGFFGGRGWLTWVGLLPMSWSWWVWISEGEIARHLDLRAALPISMERALELFAAWMLSLLISQVDMKGFKELVFQFRGTLYKKRKSALNKEDESSTNPRIL